jgi:tetratricopeptide (TPR) repeat protein
MSPRARVVTVVALAAAAVVGATVGVTLLQTRGESSGSAAVKGAPPLVLELGFRADPEARALARGAALYNDGKRAAAAKVFARYRSLEAQLGAAFARWPSHTLDDVKRLVEAHPRSALAELHLGFAFAWSGRSVEAVKAWRRAIALEPDSPVAVDAQSALHPGMAPGLPFIVSPLSPPAAVKNLPAREELQALAHAAARNDADAKLLYGLALWNIVRRPISAERQFEAAARLAPHDPFAQTAAAVGAFSKEAPVRAFARLGPLTGVFPHAAVVRFHLGLLLIWTRDVQKGVRQLRLAIADDPHSVYAREAQAFLARLPGNGTK